MEENIAILSDPETVGRSISSDAELARGEVVTEDELAQAMAVRRAMAHRTA